MAAGNPSTVRTSPILIALAEAESGSTGEIHVHFSKRWTERNPLKRAHALFHEYDLVKNPARNGVLIYVNLRRRKYAIVGDEGIAAVVGQKFWEKLSREFAVDLRSTHSEKAVAMTVRRVGEALRKHFPAT